MEEKLILAVSGYPELYNSTLPVYRNIDKKADAWRNIGALVGLSAEETKKKWKNLRDRYTKDIKADQNRVGTGQEPGAQKQWRFRHFLDFLKPFVRDRSHRASCKQEAQDYSTTSDEGDDKSQISLLPPKPALKLAAVPQLAGVTQLALVTQLTPVPPPASASTPNSAPVPVPAPSPTPGHECPPSFTSPSSSSGLSLARKRGKYKKRKLAEEEELMDDEDELFLLSLAPAMKRLTPQKRCEARIRIQRIMFEVEFL
ncbi:hypothetical protein AGOR_G00250320 [Albula goreensis]|uniref:Transcription factor Adf-1-like n=1 Tax=Albula goreensis TaxID=1534307 RepID=A0A8T3CGH5_9TELE|nr:hypothetical protein AGOR_G00250320 [Albula goreensis]